MYYRIEKWYRNNWWYIITDIETREIAESKASHMAWITGRKMRVVKVDITNLNIEPEIVATY